MYWRNTINACLVVLAIALFGALTSSDILGLDASDVPYILGFIAVGCIFMLLDKAFVRKKGQSSDKAGRRMRLDEWLATIYACLLLAIFGCASFASHCGKEKLALHIMLLGMAGLALLVTLVALFTGVIPLKSSSIDRTSEPVTFWVGTLLHLLLSIGLLALFCVFK